MGSPVFSLRVSDLERRTPGAPLERPVVYRCPGGAAFARKHLRHANALAPEFELEDTRFGYRESVRREGARCSPTCSAIPAARCSATR